MAEQKNAQNVDVNQLLKVRREKLQDLQERGKDPFQITKYDMTHHSMVLWEKLLSAIFRICRAAFSPMWHVTISEKSPTQISRNMM